jgi:hypothetical protein
MLIAVSSFIAGFSQVPKLARIPHWMSPLGILSGLAIV